MSCARRALIGAVAMLAFDGSAAARAGGAAGAEAGPCGGVDLQLTQARRHAYARLVAGAMTDRVAPAQVTVHGFMGIGAWSAVEVSTPVSDDGVFFFHRQGGTVRFSDVWGGMATASDRPELRRWAMERGAPAALAGCFAARQAQ